MRRCATAMRRAMTRAIRTTPGVSPAALIRHRRRTKRGAGVRSDLLCAEEGRGGHGENHCRQPSSANSSNSSSSSRSQSIWRSTMRRVFYACDCSNLFIPSTWDIIHPGLLPLLHAASSQPATEPTHCAHHTVHRHTATRKNSGSDPQIDTPVPCPSGAGGFKTGVRFLGVQHLRVVAVTG
jgi:hypothetical protein